MSRKLTAMALVWLMVWPLVTGALWVLRAVAAALPLAATTFLITLVLVPIITLLIGPAAALGSRWLHRSKS